MYDAMKKNIKDIFLSFRLKMRQNTLSHIKSFLIYLGSGFAISILSFFENGRNLSLSHRACDAFFIAFVLIGGLGALLFISNQGVFDIIGFSLRKVFVTHWGSKKTREESRKETFSDYKEKRRNNSKSSLPPLLAGCFFFVLSVIMLIFFYIS